MKYFFLILIFLTILPANQYDSNKFDFYGIDLRGNMVKLNYKPLTYIVLVKPIACSACIKQLSSFINNYYVGDSSSAMIILTKNQGDVLSNRENANYFGGFFNHSKVLFDFNGIMNDSVNNITPDDFVLADLPVVLRFLNSNHQIDTLTFDQFIKMRFSDKRKFFNPAIVQGGENE